MNWSDYFYYDETSPTCLRWKIDIYGGTKYSVKNISIGDIAGNFASNPEETNFSTCVKLKNKTYKLQRVIWELFNGEIPEGMVIDHLDGNAWNNKISNLACKTTAANCRNRKKNSNNTSTFAGVNIQGEKGEEQCCGSILLGNQKRKRKCFSARKYGFEKALQLAVEWRADKIKEFNIEHPEEKYTERHGT